MQSKQMILELKALPNMNLSEIMAIQPQLGFIFGPTTVFEDSVWIKKLLENSRGVQWVGCSTAGEASNDGVSDDTVVLSTLRFDNPKSKFKTAICRVDQADRSDSAGIALAKQLSAPDLRSMIVISPGVNVNGSLLVKGITESVGANVIVTGGLAGDGGKFQRTYTLSPEGVSHDHVVGIGFYGDAVHMQHGCMGGWDPFGKVRRVTKSKGNVVFELDGSPALDVYKEYLGEHAKELPASGLMFPFSLMNSEQAESGLIRTILAVDEKEGSLTFAGDVDQGAYVRLMHANTKGLVDGARMAAKSATAKGTSQDAFALIVSCVGRKLVMGINVDEEIEAIREMFGDRCTLTGFYSYGEISPYLKTVGCQLHNQTMTISYLSENTNAE